MRDNKKEDNRPDSQGRRNEKQTLADVNQWLRPISFIFFSIWFRHFDTRDKQPNNSISLLVLPGRLGILAPPDRST